MFRKLLCLFLIALTVSGFAQNAVAPKPAPKKRPRIGVALEGGSAFGLAHIGVLQWFDEHHIPVDYVAGTSMGGLVGGFYATGMSPQDLNKLVANADWDKIVSGSTEYQDLSFRRKEDQRALPNSIVLGLRNGVALPAGLNAGHPISLMIDQQTLPYHELKSFNDLPIPFRCVATDLVTGKPRVFQNGPLDEALRATMSIPGLFTPVRDNDKVYVDGGLVNNLPSDVVRDMGADIVIAVHLELAPVTANDLTSIFEVVRQTARVITAESEVRGLAQADAVVSVKLAEFKGLDFKLYQAIIAQGYAAAQARQALLQGFAITDDAEWAEYLRQRETRRKTIVGLPQFVKVEGVGPEATRNLEAALQPLVGKPIDPATLAADLTRLTGTGRYEAADYRMTQMDGRDGVVVRVHEKGYAPPMIQPAFQVDGGESSTVNFTLGARLSFMDFAGYRSEWRTDFSFGNTYAVSSEFYKPFTSSSRLFFAPHASASTTTFHIFAKNDPLADYQLFHDNVGIDVGYSSKRSTEIRVGYEVGFLSTKLRLGTPQLPPVDGRIGMAHIRWLTDHTDGPVVPRNGYSVEANFRWFDISPGTKEAFPSLDARASYFHPVTDKASLFFVGEGGSTLGFNNTGLPQYFLGGPFRLSAYGQNELRGDQYYLFRAGYRHDLFTLPPFVGKKVYVVGSWEFGKMYGATNSSRFPNNFTAGLFAETALGPLFIGESVGDTGHQKWFFFLGRVF
jgi:NTE family protein